MEKAVRAETLESVACALLTNHLSHIEGAHVYYYELSFWKNVKTIISYRSLTLNPIYCPKFLFIYLFIHSFEHPLSKQMPINSILAQSYECSRV
jgi:hypothetical protein